MSQFRILSSVLTLAAIATTGLIGSPSSQAAESTTPLIEQTSTQLQIAQATGSEDSYNGSLSVTGTSQINAPADQAIILLTYYSNSYYSSDSSEPNSSQSLQVQPADLKTVVDALTAAGIPAGSIKAYPDFTSPGSMKVRLTIAQPTQARLEELIETANTAATKNNRFTTSGASVGYTVQDCQSVENQARQAAMTDANNRANALANVAGRQIGQVVSLGESVSWGSSYSTTCPATNDPSAYSDIYSLPMYDPSLPPVVKVVYSLSVTYQMK